MPELHPRSLHEIAADIQRKALSPVELLEDVLCHIARDNPQLNAYISVYAEEAREQARASEQRIMRSEGRGPLDGIPMGIKDNFFYAGHVTTMGSAIDRDFIPNYTATALQRLIDAGVVIVGKLNLHEYALGVTTENPHFGTAHNPWAHDRIAGGSSGGAGVALPTGMSIGSIGSDTSGSIRIPAACCGIIGLKPTYGLVSKHGCYPEAWSLDHVGPMATAVQDVALILDAIAGYDARDPLSEDRPWSPIAPSLKGTIRKKTIGINKRFLFHDVDDAMLTATYAALDALQQAGAILKEVEIDGIDLAEYALTIIDTSETTTVHRHNIRTRPQDYGDDVRQLILNGLLPSAVDYLQAQQVRARLKHSFARVFEQVDLLVSPTLPIETPHIGQKTATINGREVDAIQSMMRLIGPANLVGIPSISVPMGRVADLPAGLQLIGPAFGEKTVLDAALAIEAMDLANG